MSDQELKLEQSIASAMGEEIIQPKVEAVQPAQPTAPTKPTAGIIRTTVQTVENTVAHEVLPRADQTKGEFDPNDNLHLHVNGFIGLSKTSYARVSAELDMWQEYIGAKAAESMSDREKAKQGISVSQIQAAVTAWEEYCAENYAGQELDVINDRQRKIYSYINNIADGLLLQYPVVKEKGLTNQFQRTSTMASGDIVGLVPDRDQKKFSLSEFMRRSSMNVVNEPFMFDVLCRNSYVAFRYAKPTRLEIGGLIRDIGNAVRGHVRDISQNVPALANTAAIRVAWKFIANRIKQISVKDTDDFNDLADIIRITDMNPIMNSLLGCAYPSGVNFNLACLANHQGGCGWNATRVIDPTLLTIDRKWLDTPEESAAYANMLNYSRKYSREESLKFIKNTNFQHDITPVWNRNKRACFILGVPSLTESFEAEEFFSELIRTELDGIRERAMTEQQYFTDRDEFLDGLVGTDYLHYISEYQVHPEEGTDGEVVVFRRNESDPKEFNQGIVNIIQENVEMATDLVSAVIKHYPFMSKTFVGLDNYICESCGEKAEGYEDLGYTPINIMSAFFTLASLMYTGRSTVGGNAKQEALLAVSQ